MSAYITQRLRAALAKMREGRIDEAEGMISLVLKAQPEHAEAHGMLASIHLSRGHTQKAIAHAQRAVRSDPASIPARQTLVGVLTAAGERQEALDHIDRLLALNAGTPELAATHAGTLRDLLRYDEAIAVHRRALERFPGDPALVAMLPYSLNYVPGASREEMFAAHVAFGELIDRTHPAVHRKFRNNRDPERTLRVGFMSADLHTHSVAYFLEPILRHANPARMAAYLYQTAAPISDTTTARLRGMSAALRPVAGLPPGRVAEVVLDDQIDVLIELNGLMTTTAALPVMNLSPAPVTATYIGYPNTTGVRSVRHRFVDSITDPPGSDAFAVERLVRLDPCFLCYAPSSDSPPANAEPPCRRTGSVTFGSFNNIQKLNDGVIGAWAKIVSATPGARLLLKHFRLREPSLRRELQDRFARAGLAPGRVELLMKEQETRAHLRLYDRMDVALDPFPYNGTTTTCEAVHQGVPVVTLRGDRHAARVGASLLTALGTPELVAHDPESYIALAVGLANDHARLTAYRTGLRPALLSSPLCDGAAFGARFEREIRRLWGEWCGTAAG